MIWIMGPIKLDIMLNLLVAENNDSAYLFLSACYVNCSKFNSNFDKMVKPIISKNTKILKESRLPLKGDINCKVGDKVKNSTIVASTFIPGNIHMVNIINQLNIDAQSIKDYLTVKIDDKIKFYMTLGNHD